MVYFCSEFWVFMVRDQAASLGQVSEEAGGQPQDHPTVRQETDTQGHILEQLAMRSLPLFQNTSH